MANRNSLRILISNDDGIYAEGINVLYRAVSKVYPETFVVAPFRNQSAASHCLTIEYPIRVQPLPTKNFIAVRGTPTDSVYLALNELIEPQPQVVLSGINEGPNLGDDVIYSGTVAAATTGRGLGLPAMAISLCGRENYETAAFFALKILGSLSACPMPPNQILNINVPDLPLSEIKGIKVTRLGTRAASDSVIKAQDPRGKPVYWVGPQGRAVDVAEDTDFFAIRNGYVSVTPLHIDLTSYRVIDELTAWAEHL